MRIQAGNGTRADEVLFSASSSARIGMEVLHVLDAFSAGEIGWLTVAGMLY